MLRRALELASRNVIFKRRIPQRYGGCAFYASPEGGLRYWRANVAKIDPALLDVAADTVTPGAVVWDIGANVGLFSFAAAGLAGPSGRVFSVEPDTFLVGLLRRSAALSNPTAAPVQVIPLAVSSGLALQTFRIAARARSSNYLDGFGTTQSGGDRETQTVMTVSLDWLATQLPAPTVVKIDAEAAETLILQSAVDLLRRYRPTVICEVAGENAADVTRILRECGYVIYDAEHPRDQRQPVASAPWATLAFPEEQEAGRAPDTIIGHASRSLGAPRLPALPGR